MIAAANREIRRQLQLAELRRAQVMNSPIAQLDRLITELEEKHLEGQRRVPVGLLPAFTAINQLLPEGMPPLPEQAGSIRYTIDRCFDLQERMLGVSDEGLLGRPE
jgi:hypothetical protein